MTENLSPLKQAFLAIEELQAKLEAAQRTAGISAEPIAVIGMGCRMPGSANDPQAFWKNLKNGVDAICDIPAERWAADAFYDPDPDAPGKSYLRQAGFLDQVDGFDPQFFGIAPREAHAMDPQQRLLLEVAWEALENAAIAPDTLNGSRTGVFVGISSMDYASRTIKANDPAQLDTYYASGISHSIASGRLAYVLGLQGPAVSVDTACSSSLLAGHLAVQSLRMRESDLALAAGVNLILLPDNQIAYSRLRMLATDGRCKTFDARADGFGDGEGCGVVVLKRLSDAQRDGDRILAVIRGSAANQDGASSGLTAPNGPAQEAVIRAALQNSGVRPEEVGYIEAHGTGTALGDPIEVRALANVLRDGRPAGRSFLLGSVKTNIGHLEAAAGVAGLIKTVLALQHGEVPPHLHFETPNPLLAWDEIPAKIPTSVTPWPDGYDRRIAGVSAFGFSGTNVHMLLEAAPQATANAPAQTAERPLHLLALSARTEPALLELAGRYEDFLAQPESAHSFADVAYSANTGRANLPARLTVLAGSTEQAREKLAAYRAAGEANGVASGRIESSDPPKIAFLFTGQGAQYPGMGRQLYETQAVFRAALERCEAIYQAQTGESLLDAIYPSEAAQAERIHQTEITQPALFAVEYALAQMWLAWGIQPAALAGHSLGEYVAAVLAGVFSLEDGLKLVTARGRLMGALPAGGAMSAIFAPAAQVQAAMEALPDAAQQVSIAAVNAPDSTVISGAHDAVQAVAEVFQAQGVRVSALKVSHAFHSHLVEPMLAAFERVAESVQYARPKLRLVSDVSGELAREQVASARYWREHVRQAVQFQRAVETLYREGCDIFLEIGPHPALISMGQRTLAEPQRKLAWVGTLKREQDDWAQVLAALGQLYVAGAPVDWTAFDRPYPRRKLALPTYPFQRQRYWLEAKPAAPIRQRGQVGHPLLGEKLRSPAQITSYENTLSAQAFSFLNDHRVFGSAILPATGFVEMALAAGRAYHGEAAFAIEDFTIHTALRVEDGEARLLQTLLTPGKDGAALEIYSQPPGSDAWTLHASATLAARAAQLPAAENPAQVQARLSETRSAAEHYARLAENGLAFGESLKGVARIWRGDHEALGEIEPTQAVSAESGYLLHPALLDAHLQVLAAALPASPDVYLPIHIARFQTFAGGAPRWSHVRLAQPAGRETLTASLTLLDDEARVVAWLGEVTLKRADPASLRPSAAIPGNQWLYETTWQPVDIQTTTVSSGAKLSLAALAGALDPALDQLYRQNGLDEYVNDLSPELDRLTRIYISNAVIKLGWKPQPEETFNAAGLAEQLHILPQHRRLMGYLLNILAEDGFIEPHGEAWRVQRIPQPEDAALLYASLVRIFPQYAAEMEITARCGAQLAEALSGTADPLQLIFPGGSLDTAEKIYQKSPAALTYNGLVREAVAGILAQRGEGQPGPRVLEIGAGTGGTTSFVLPVLPASSEYTFTDISPLFAARAQQKFSAYPFVRYQTLDIEQDPDAQGLAGQQFDLIIAANVIHATQDLRVTLRHVRKLLARGGAFVMLEVTAPQRWVDITFGLTDGWWRFTDKDLRPAYPLLSRPQWTALLEASGFREAVSIPQVSAQSAVNKIEEAVIIASAAPQTAEGWLLVADADDTVGDAVAGRLTDQGADCKLIANGADNLADEVAKTNAAHVMFLGGNLPALLAVTQAAAANPNPPRLWLVTRGAQPVQGNKPDPMQARVWGFGKVVALEHPELHPARVDLDPAADDPAAALAEAIATAQNPAAPEDELAIRGGQVLAARLAPALLPGESTPAALIQERPGALDGLAWLPVERAKAAAGQVEIHVQAAGLNFKDLMIALGMAPQAALGMECAGVISAVGEGVQGFAAGDPVMAVASGSFADYALAEAAFTAPMPANLSTNQAAAQLVAFITAGYALEHIGQMQRGQRVLIHAGAGGVGQAAIQLARRAGAEIFATAGTPEKRDLLRRLGVQHVFDSRSLDFGDEILRITGGGGVHLALNSLAGDFIPATLRVVAEGGHFLEIGKSGLLMPEEAAQHYPALHYHVIDWSEQARSEPALVAALAQQIVADLASGALQPLPIHVFEASEAQAAFRFMQQARHSGRIVLAQPHRADAPLARPDATYLVTGGLRGIGLLTAEWLADQGACHLALMGRSAPTSSAQGTLERLQARGVTVRVLQGDVSREGDLAAALNQIQASLPPLRGIIHAAGVLDDAALLNQTWERFETVLAPKANGAELLHRLSVERGLPLDFFVLYSSVASVFGSRGQANHAAANAHMDALAHARRAQGLPALSINWGVWSEVGAAADRGAVQRSAAQGIASFSPAEGLAVLDRLMRSPAVQVTVSPMDWPVFLRTHAETTPPLLRGIAAQAARASARSDAQPTGAAPSTAAARPSFLRELNTAPADRKPALLLHFVQAQAAKVLGLDARAVLEHTPLSEMGLDSLMAVELRNLLGKALELERPLPVTMVFDYPTITAMRDYLAGTVLHLNAAPEAAAQPARGGEMLDSIEDLSDEDVEKLIGELKKGTK